MNYVNSRFYLVSKGFESARPCSWDIDYGKSENRIKFISDKEGIFKIINVADSTISDIEINKVIIKEKNLLNFPDTMPLEEKNFLKKRNDERANQN